MYDELVKRLRAQAVYLPEKFSKNAELLDVLMKAADAIEELQGKAKVLEKLADKWCEAVPKWIPVTERLPEPNAVDKYGFTKGYLVKTDRHVMMHTARYNGEWWVLWGKATVITDTVTHWMLLPETPKEESNGV